MHSWKIRKLTAPLGYNWPYSLSLCQYSLTPNQTRRISPEPKASDSQTGDYQTFLPAVKPFCKWIYPRIFPCLCFQESKWPVIISTTCFRFLTSIQMRSCARCEERFRRYFAHLLTTNSYSPVWLDEKWLIKQTTYIA